ncbi:BTAD domain-containing putative transcriptional regulator [Streptomyces sp. NPDC101776]|uniref:AfsR/SARP family transcriptional regulator n=1 Tax=Streptomyces sp. NPDC101776 TaxID=3366146 RepID=UPI0038195ECA
MQAGVAAPRPGQVRFSVLGPLSVTDGGAGALPLGPLKQRVLLAMLLCRPNSMVSVEALTDALWDDGPPRTARKNIQVHVWALRKLLEGACARGRLVRGAGGYLLSVDEEELDSLRFRRLAAAGREAADRGELPLAARLSNQALTLWSGPALPELRCSRSLSDEAGHLDREYLQVYEDWAEAELWLGNARAVAGTIRELTALHPHRERLRAAHMNTLFRLGRQTEAFAVYDEYRQLLAGEFGLGPSPVLEAQYRSMLTGGKNLISRPGRVARSAPVGP